MFLVHSQLIKISMRETTILHLILVWAARVLVVEWLPKPFAVKKPSCVHPLYGIQAQINFVLADTMYLVDFARWLAC